MQIVSEVVPVNSLLRSRSMNANSGGEFAWYGSKTIKPGFGPVNSEVPKPLCQASAIMRCKSSFVPKTRTWQFLATGLKIGNGGGKTMGGIRAAEEPAYALIATTKDRLERMRASVARCYS